MGHLKSLDLPESDRATAQAARRERPTGSRAWVWVVFAALAIGGFWYYKTTHSKNAEAAAATAGAGKAGKPGAGAGGLGGFSVPVVVAIAAKGDLPVYLNGLGNVTPLNTVT